MSEFCNFSFISADNNKNEFSMSSKFDLGRGRFFAVYCLLLCSAIDGVIDVDLLRSKHSDKHVSDLCIALCVSKEDMDNSGCSFTFVSASNSRSLFDSIIFADFVFKLDEIGENFVFKFDEIEEVSILETVGEQIVTLTFDFDDTLELGIFSLLLIFVKLL